VDQKPNPNIYPTNYKTDLLALIQKTHSDDMLDVQEAYVSSPMQKQSGSEGPYFIVTAALEHVPPPLIEQLRVGGRLVMPLGSAQAIQQLTVAEKIAEGKMKTRAVMLVRFVPFTRSPD
jgi:protein-L-isoaspartate O-methyltransferase